MNTGVGRKLEELNRLRCIALFSANRYRLRIEDINHKPLTEFVERTRKETRYITEASIVGTEKEDWQPMEDGEDYRIPVINEATLRARLYLDE